ncbi:unnamed protein product [Protopolystoma xenopodis]|uniref:Uncharacterized protein n=1 Tax=Protopolystoma xenopodis TaxID=117903 RepID=A0A3S5A4Y5_9PLAT|nr:unnamed protein product [Protopolystoma xenopodis]
MAPQTSKGLVSHSLPTAFPADTVCCPPKEDAYQRTGLHPRCRPAPPPRTPGRSTSRLERAARSHGSTTARREVTPGLFRLATGLTCTQLPRSGATRCPARTSCANPASAICPAPSPSRPDPHSDSSSERPSFTLYAILLCRLATWRDVKENRLSFPLPTPASAEVHTNATIASASTGLGYRYNNSRQGSFAGRFQVTRCLELPGQPEQSQRQPGTDSEWARLEISLQAAFSTRSDTCFKARPGQLSSSSSSSSSLDWLLRYLSTAPLVRTNDSGMLRTQRVCQLVSPLVDTETPGLPVTLWLSGGFGCVALGPILIGSLGRTVPAPVHVHFVAMPKAQLPTRPARRSRVVWSSW